ncbi:hypothetical protein C7W93_10895 [Glaciimonas sp. PCH181]|nr:hypothetical protein C7W93_10895 [Glaciimonas sp. PCH181]
MWLKKPLNRGLQQGRKTTAAIATGTVMKGWRYGRKASQPDSMLVANRLKNHQNTRQKIQTNGDLKYAQRHHHGGLFSRGNKAAVPKGNVVSELHSKQQKLVNYRGDFVAFLSLFISSLTYVNERA